MAASAQLLLSALSKPAGSVDSPCPVDPTCRLDHQEPVNPLDLDGLSDPDSGLEGASSSEWAEPPLTSEPPLADTAPLTSEPPLAELPLTSEPTALGGNTETMEV
ncbi:hypothetical protein AB0C51_22905 [Streptomyces pathocidini]|uniref:Uncharacterized protein n=1 Tax=Streptomyces pathocidini TaxID=1650571 RepID=A0ABW7UU90_9ACTN|nr:hypothetical protein [Streptomyces pathocidini]